jgi:hypothetical protein
MDSEADEARYGKLDVDGAYPPPTQVSDLQKLLDEAHSKIRSLSRHWNEFGDMMGIEDDYGFGEKMEDAERILPENQS